MISEDVIVDDNEPFRNCQLGRKQHSDVLNKILEIHSDGFVMSIDGAWGTGKSTFVRMWAQELKNKGYSCALFNAWENDFMADPLVGILGELKPLLGKDEIQIAKLTKQVCTFTAKNLGSLLEIAAMFAGAGVASGAVKQGVHTISNLIKDNEDAFVREVSEYEKRKNSLHDFRQKLENLVASSDIKKPIVVIVDELDRCRPNYAVETLEAIKHLFAVKGIVFILAVNKKQLCHSINGVYGSEKMDSNEYLRRFIDMDYQLCDLTLLEFVKSQLVKYKILGDDEESCNVILQFLCVFFRFKHLSLRQIEKIILRFSISISYFNGAPEFLLPMLVFIYSKEYEPEHYNVWKNGMSTSTIDLYGYNAPFELNIETPIQSLKIRRSTPIFAYVAFISLIYKASKQFSASPISSRVEKFLQPTEPLDDWAYRYYHIVQEQRDNFFDAIELSQSVSNLH